MPSLWETLQSIQQSHVAVLQYLCCWRCAVVLLLSGLPGQCATALITTPALAHHKYSPWCIKLAKYPFLLLSCSAHSQWNFIKINACFFVCGFYGWEGEQAEQTAERGVPLCVRSTRNRMNSVSCAVFLTCLAFGHCCRGWFWSGGLEEPLITEWNFLCIFLLDTCIFMKMMENLANMNNKKLTSINVF